MAIQSINQKSLPSSQNWVGVVWTGAKFLALCRNAGLLAESTDGIVWTQSTKLMVSNWACIAAGGGKVMVVSDTNTPGVQWSSDHGATWTSYAAPSHLALPFGAALYLPTIDRFMVINKQSGNDASAHWPSGSTASFIGNSVAADINANDLAWGAGLVVAPPVNGDYSAWLSDLASTSNWVGGGNMGATGGWSTLTYGAGKFVALKFNSATYATSTDGKTWTSRTLPVSGQWRKIRFGVNMFLAIADDGKALASADGLTWTQFAIPVASYTGLAASDSCFVAVSNGAVGLLSVHVKITGTVRDAAGAYAARTVRCYDRATGVLASETNSSAVDGSFTLYPSTPNACYVVALDDEAGDVLNALIFDRVTPA